MTKGLFLARTFYKAGHTVIGADFEPHRIPVCGRFSKALRTFYSLPKPNETSGAAYYIDALLEIVRKEKVDLWVSCSGVASAVEDAQAKEVLERRSDVRCIQFDVSTTQILHEKDTFIARTQHLGLPIPETHNVTSRAAVHKVLHESPRSKKQYIMKSVGVDDAFRADMTLLPKRTLSDTYNHVSAIPISDKKPWVLQQFVRGREYCTHALIVNNDVKAFVACPSAELLMHYDALPSTDALSKAMLRFTEEFARRNGGSMTGHLSFDFLVEEAVSEKGAGMSILPIECNPRAHTAVVLFRGQERALSAAYMSALTPHVNGTRELHHDGGSDDVQFDIYDQPTTLTQNTRRVENGYTSSTPPPNVPVSPAANPPRCYWFGHDIVTLLFLPFLAFYDRRITMSEYSRGCRTFLEHVLLWRDGTFEVWDPLPAWWLYHVYWPGQFLAAAVGRRKWSRVNVSTCKIFGC